MKALLICILTIVCPITSERRLSIIIFRTIEDLVPASIASNLRLWRLVIAAPAAKPPAANTRSNMVHAILWSRSYVNAVLARPCKPAIHSICTGGQSASAILSVGKALPCGACGRGKVPCVYVIDFPELSAPGRIAHSGAVDNGQDNIVADTAYMCLGLWIAWGGYAGRRVQVESA